MSALSHSLNISPLLQQYLSLSHIIYRKKYLIPQRPLPPQPLTVSTNLIQTYIKYFPEKANEPNLQNQLQNLQFSQMVKLIKQKQKEEKEIYHKKILKYEQKYISPIQTYEKKITPPQLYYRDQKQTLMNSLKQQNKKFKINHILQYYNSISNEAKLKYQQESQKINSQIKVYYEPIVQKYRIPQLNYKTNLSFYHMELQKLKIPLQKYKPFKQISEDQKDKIDIKCHKYNMELQEQFKLFLKRHKISLKKYKEIIKISSAITQQLKKYKNQKPIGDQSIIHQQMIVEKVKQFKTEHQEKAQTAKSHKKIQQKSLQQEQISKKQNQSKSQNVLKQQLASPPKPIKILSNRPKIDVQLQGQFSEEECLQHDEQQLLLLRQIKKMHNSISKQAIDKQI